MRVFWMAPTDYVARYLRRYSSSAGKDITCTSTKGYHNAMVPLDTFYAGYQERGAGTHVEEDFKHDPRWPTTCECGYVFTEEDPYQIFTDTIYRRFDTNELIEMRKAPPGAMWHASWIAKYAPLYGQENDPHCLWRGPDQLILMVRLPNSRDWCVDDRASNCTMPDDNRHRCWVRHGDVLRGNVHVDKNGFTCNAGAGSVWSDQGGPASWHGFLHNGELVT